MGDFVVAVKTDHSNWTLDDIKRGWRGGRKSPLADGEVKSPDFLPPPVRRHRPPSCGGCGDGDLLIYNRVPKCASSTVQTVLEVLSRANNFSYESLPFTSAGRAWSEAQERAFVHGRPDGGGDSGPRAVDGHFYFVDFGRYEDEKKEEDGRRAPPVWINLVREPLERVESSFSYLRHPKRWPEGKDRPPKVGAVVHTYVPM